MSKQSDEFVKRLHELCDELGIAPGHGRQTALARMFKIKQQTVNLWFKGENEPTLANARAMVMKTRLQLDWFMTGRLPKTLEKQRMRQKVQQLVTLAEPQSDYVLDQLIKIVPALTQPAANGDNGGNEGEKKAR